MSTGLQGKVTRPPKILNEVANKPTQSCRRRRVRRLRKRQASGGIFHRNEGNRYSGPMAFMSIANPRWPTRGGEDTELGGVRQRVAACHCNWPKRPMCDPGPDSDSCTAAKQRRYSITSSAHERSDSRIVRPIGLGSIEINGKLKPAGSHDRQVGGLFAPPPLAGTGEGGTLYEITLSERGGW